MRAPLSLGPRVGISLVLIAGSIVLLISIVVGNTMGNRVLSQVSHRADAFVPSPAPTLSVDRSLSGPAAVAWKGRHIVSVATDPGFPDPRVTPEPPPPPAPRPAPKRTPIPTASPRGEGTNSHYTSPPLPLPIVSHDPNEQSDPDGQPIPTDSQSPAGPDAPRPASAAPAHAGMETP
jgi:hypothetical protein